MKKIFPFVIIVLTITGLLYFVVYKNSYSPKPTTKAQTGVSAWKTYRNSEFGFSIKYPSQYATEEHFVATSTQWGSRILLTISNTPDTATNEFGISPVQVTLKRQPVTASGKVYHTISEYQKSGTAAQMVQGIQNPDGELITVNGVQTLKYYFPAGDTSDTSSDAYFFIKNDLIYEIGFDANNPDKTEMLQSIEWD